MFPKTKPNKLASFIGRHKGKIAALLISLALGAPLAFWRGSVWAYQQYAASRAEDGAKFANLEAATQGADKRLAVQDTVLDGVKDGIKTMRDEQADFRRETRESFRDLTRRLDMALRGGGIRNDPAPVPNGITKDTGKP